MDPRFRCRRLSRRPIGFEEVLVRPSHIMHKGLHVNERLERTRFRVDIRIGRFGRRATQVPARLKSQGFA